MGIVAVLQPDARLRAQVLEALAQEHCVTACSDWAEIHRTVAQRDVDAIVVDADVPEPSVATSELRTLRAKHDVAVLVWTESGSPERFFDLGGAGVDALIPPSARPSAIRDLVSRSVADACGRTAAALLPAAWPEEATAAMGWAVAHAGEAPRVQDLADGIGVPATRLREMLRDGGLPTPAELLLWGRLARAGAHFGDPSRTVESVAYSLGYATAGALSRAMRRHTGLTSVQVREGDGMPGVLRALLERRKRRRGTALSGAVRLSWAASVALLLTLAAGCASVPSVDHGAVDRLLSAPPMDQLHAGVLVVDAGTGVTLYAHNERRRFVPASNQKVLVAATALSLLGGDHRFRTDVLLDGPLTDGVVEGDLVLRPTGDPSMSARFWASGTAALEALADSVRSAGVHRVRGRIRVDATAWDSTTIGPTREVADLPWAYGASGSILAIDEGEVTLVVEAGPRVGDRASVRWSDGGDRFVRARVETIGADSTGSLSSSYLPESRRLVVHGGIPLGRTDTLTVAQRDPLGVAVRASSNAFQRAGIQVDDGWIVDWDAHPSPCIRPRPTCPEPLATLWSPPLSQLLSGILESSQNWMTEQLVRALGARYGRKGSWDEGTGVMHAYLVNEVGVVPSDLSPRDGSGLSAYNLVTPRAMVRVLKEMAEGPSAEAFRSALAEPSEEGSTLETRLSGLEDRVFAKTGTISNVNSLSGYLVRDDGDDVIFSILTNGSGLPASRLRPVIDDIVRVLARTPSSP